VTVLPGWAALGLSLLLVFVAPTAAETLRLDGPLVQGGLVIGHTEPGAAVAVAVDGRASRDLRVSADGLFLIGLGRDAPPRLTVRVKHAGGATTTRTLEIARRTYQVQRIDGLPRRQVTPGAAELRRIKADNAAIAGVRAGDSAGAHFASGFAWPVEGRLSGVFGSRRILNGVPRRPHNGLDITASRGTPVMAAAAGIVALARPDMFLTGQTVMIDHGHGLTSVYAHMSGILVKEGQPVAKGAPIGLVGATGRVTGAHLHWGVTWFATHVDPGLLVGPSPVGE
jgi:murein DD-endopeptidase MepM/ murein hydrolase activator NlpD